MQFKSKISDMEASLINSPKLYQFEALNTVVEEQKLRLDSLILGKKIKKKISLRCLLFLYFFDDEIIFLKFGFA